MLFPLDAKPTMLSLPAEVPTPTKYSITPEWASVKEGKLPLISVFTVNVSMSVPIPSKADSGASGAVQSISKY